MNNTIIWHNVANEGNPTRSGAYLAISDLGRNSKDSLAEYACVSVERFFRKGDKIPLFAEHHYPRKFETMEERALYRITHQVFMEVVKSNWYGVDVDSDPWEINNITWWAELPALPKCYDGNQNDYDQ